MIFSYTARGNADEIRASVKAAPEDKIPASLKMIAHPKRHRARNK